MAAEITIFKIKDFVRVRETGQIDVNRSKQLIREIATAAAFQPGHNILVDLRDTSVAIGGMNDLLEVVTYFARYKPFLGNKIASVVPDDEGRLTIARKFKACLNNEGFAYDFFTDFEAAIEWLSDTSHQN